MFTARNRKPGRVPYFSFCSQCKRSEPSQSSWLLPGPDNYGGQQLQPGSGRDSVFRQMLEHAGPRSPNAQVVGRRIFRAQVLGHHTCGAGQIRCFHPISLDASAPAGCPKATGQLQGRRSTKNMRGKCCARSGTRRDLASRMGKQAPMRRTKNRGSGQLVRRWCYCSCRPLHWPSSPDRVGVYHW